jgi:hypothetical protein
MAARNKKRKHLSNAKQSARREPDAGMASERRQALGGQHASEVEQQPAVERGERLDSGKTIARGSRSHGFVPGASPE